jgi:hypothetical protein
MIRMPWLPKARRYPAWCQQPAIGREAGIAHAGPQKFACLFLSGIVRGIHVRDPPRSTSSMSDALRKGYLLLLTSVTVENAPAIPKKHVWATAARFN